MNKTKLTLATDSSIRADKFRVKLVLALEQNKKAPLDHEEAIELIRTSYHLLGNLQMYVNEYRREMIALQNQGLLED